MMACTEGTVGGEEEEDEKKVDKVKSELLDFLTVADSSEETQALLSKLQSKKISEDGNSETAAENETEQDTNNAENKDNKESEND